MAVAKQISGGFAEGNLVFGNNSDYRINKKRKGCEFLMEYDDLLWLDAFRQAKEKGQVHYGDNVSMKIQSTTIAGWRQRYWRHLWRVANFGNLCQIKCIKRTLQSKY